MIHQSRIVLVIGKYQGRGHFGVSHYSCIRFIGVWFRNTLPFKDQGMLEYLKSYVLYLLIL